MKKLLLVSFLVSILFSSFAQVPKPVDVFGFEPGADYKLAKHDQMISYFKQLSESSPRVLYEEIGKTVLGRPMITVIISSESNIAEVGKYREISEKLAKAKISRNEAESLISEGKSIIWVDGGLHATEVAGAQMTPELAYRVATEESSEMKKIRDNVIMVLMPVMNPDGLDIVADWYYRNLGTEFETSRPPWLYHHYIGHDNNRDWFMNNMPESYHVNDAIYRKWYPQVVYNHHQTSPAWARIFIPPFSNPVNPRIHPGVTTATNLIGTVMANRFAMKKMPGVVSYQTYSMWWNGGMRTVPYYHNMVGILSETAHATPTPRYYDPEKRPSSVGGRRGGMAADGTQIFYPYPWKGGESKFRDAVDYMLTGSMAVLDYAADRREEYLRNIYEMGRDAIEGTMLGENYTYIISADQPEYEEAIDLINILIRGGIEIDKATRKFSVGDKEYPAGSYIISTAQSFRPYLEDLMETQSYPDQYLYPGGPPTPPYDLAGWTLPMQMGVEFDKTSAEVNARTTPVSDLESPSGMIAKGAASKYYLLSTNQNASYKAVNQLLASGIKVHTITSAEGEFQNGDFLIESTDSDMMEEVGSKTGADFKPVKGDVNGLKEVKRPKVGLYKSWVSNMDEGWTRWLLTEYSFDWDTLHNEQIKTGNLDQYDVIILPDQNPTSILHGHREGDMPDEFIGGIGLEGTQQLKDYISSGGRVITFDAAGDFMIEHLGLPVRNVLSNLSPQQFFIPGSLIRADVQDSPYTWGMTDDVAVSFSSSSAYSIITSSSYGEGGEETTVKKVEDPAVDILVKYSKEDLLMSGWAMGEERYLRDRAAMLSVPYEKGNIILIGFRPQFRGQSRATYKLVFNSILRD